MGGTIHIPTDGQQRQWHLTDSSKNTGCTMYAGSAVQFLEPYFRKIASDKDFYPKGISIFLISQCKIMFWLLIRKWLTTVLLISTHNIYFHQEIRKKYLEYLDTTLIWSNGYIKLNDFFKDMQNMHIQLFLHNILVSLGLLRSDNIGPDQMGLCCPKMNFWHGMSHNASYLPEALSKGCTSKLDAIEQNIWFGFTLLATHPAVSKT